MRNWFIIFLIVAISSISVQQSTKRLFCPQYRERVEFSFDEFDYREVDDSLILAKTPSRTCEIRISVNYHQRKMIITFDVGRGNLEFHQTTLEMEQSSSDYKTMILVSILLLFIFLKSVSVERARLKCEIE
jgi:hypothetical protein